jgi:hypothetical protein
VVVLGAARDAGLTVTVGWGVGLMLVAGIIHIVLLPLHIEEARGSGLYMGILGAAQVMWAVLQALRPTRRWAWIGLMALAVQPIAVYAITRVWRQPFSDAAEGVDLMGVLTKTFELAAIPALAHYLALTRPVGMSAGRAVAMPVATAIVVGLLLGGALYGAGLAAEDLVPALAEGEGGEHGVDEGATAATATPAGSATTTSSAHIHPG